MSYRSEGRTTLRTADKLKDVMCIFTRYEHVSYLCRPKINHIKVILFNILLAHNMVTDGGK